MICSWHAAPAKGSADPYQGKASFGLAFPASAATDGTLGESQKYRCFDLIWDSQDPKKQCLPTRMDQVGRLLAMKSRKADVYFLPDTKRTHAPSTVVPLHSVQPWKNTQCPLSFADSQLKLSWCFHPCGGVAKLNHTIFKTKHPGFHLCFPCFCQA